MATFCPALIRAEEVVDDNLIRRIAEFDVFKLDIARDAVETLSLAAFVVKLALAEEFEYTFARRGGALKVVERLRKLRQRLGEQPDIYHERHDNAEGDRAVNRERRSDHAYTHITKVADKSHERHHDTRQKLRFPRAAVELIVDFLENTLGLSAAVIRLDDVMAGIDFLDVSVYVSQLTLLDRKIFLRHFYDQHHQDKSNGACGYCGQ